MRKNIPRPSSDGSTFPSTLGNRFRPQKDHSGMIRGAGVFGIRLLQLHVSMPARSIREFRRPKAAAVFSMVLLLYVLSACGSSRSVTSTRPELPPGFPNHSVSEILNHLPDTPPDFFELYAETVVSLSSPTEKGRFSTRIAYRQGDSLLIRVRFPLGIEGARVLVTRDSAFVYDRIHNEVIIGSRTTIASALPGAVFGTDFVEKALDFVQPDPNIDWRLSADSLRYHLYSPDSTLRLDVDPVVWRIVHIATYDPSGMVLEQRWYTDFTMFNQHLLPRRLILSRPPEDTRLSMVLRKVDTNPDALSFKLGLKDDTRRIFIR